jgi:hypothetical protein
VSAWCMAHPWMTFCLVALALVVVESIALNWRRK